MPMLSRRLATLLTSFFVASFVAGCSGSTSPSVDPGPSSTPIPPSQEASGPLVTVETRGGHCLEGACGSTTVIESDGRIHAMAPSAEELGTVPDVTLEGLVTEIAGADFAALKSRPFTGTCPIAFDGQETIYTFATATGDERIASCEVEIDPAHPLFVAVSAVLAGLPAR